MLLQDHLTMSPCCVKQQEMILKTGKFSVPGEMSRSTKQPAVTTNPQATHCMQWKAATTYFDFVLASFDVGPFRTMRFSHRVDRTLVLRDVVLHLIHFWRQLVQLRRLKSHMAPGFSIFNVSIDIASPTIITHGTGVFDSQCVDWYSASTSRPPDALGMLIPCEQKSINQSINQEFLESSK